MTEPEKKSSLDEEVTSFVNQIDGLAQALPPALHSINEANLAALHELLSFFKNECLPIVEADGAAKRYTIPSGKGSRFNFLNSKGRKTDLASELVPRSFLVALVSQFDSFLGRLIQHLFKNKPEVLNNSEKYAHVLPTDWLWILRRCPRFYYR